MKIVWTVLAVVGLLVLAVLAVAYGGLADVSATGPEPAPVAWFLETTRHSAIERATDDLEVPPLDDAATLRTGLVHYHEMCVTCHGAPGVRPAELVQGLNPVPPDLAEHAEEPAETFWIVKHGLKMTGMPAFGPTHSDEELWAVAAFVDRLPELTAEEYASMVRSAGMTLDAGGGHGHGGGGHAGAQSDGGGHERGADGHAQGAAADGRDAAVGAAGAPHDDAGDDAGHAHPEGGHDG